MTYGQVPEGLEQIEPVGGRPAPLQEGHLYGLALIGEKLFALTVFYRDADGVHVMEGGPFAESVIRGKRRAVHSFLDRP